MTLEDPFYIVKEDVLKSVTKTRGLFHRWSDLKDDETVVGKEELEWTTTELRNSLRSIEWDLEDLEDTVDIAEKNPKKFKIGEEEIRKRLLFLTEVREEVRAIKENVVVSKTKERKPKQSINIVSGPGTTKYIRLLNELESPEHQFVIQQPIEQKCDLNPDMVEQTVIGIKNEIDEQAIMLESGLKTDTIDPTLSTGSNKITQALHLTRGKQQWLAIGVFSGMMVLVVTLIVFL